VNKTRTLPVFPLRRVLVPGEALVLHIFEPRYRNMIAGLVDDRFGLVLIRDGAEVGGGADYHDVGTVARIMERRELEDGRMLLAMVGEQRFEVVDRLPEEPFPEAKVALLMENDGPSESGLEGLVDEVGNALRRYLVVSAEAGEGGDVLFEMSRDPVEASYQVASLLRLVSPERQELLEQPTAEDRLARELTLLRREADLLERTMDAR
jgi:Lon protease-like protein